MVKASYTSRIGSSHLAAENDTRLTHEEME